MTLERKMCIARGLSVIVMISGIMVSIGWILDISTLKSLSPEWVSMKFSTSISFFLSGIALYFIVTAVEGEFEKTQVVISLTSLLLVLLMGTLFISALLNMHTGIDDLFIREQAGAVKSVFPGRPSMPTMLSFILMASAGILTILQPKRLRLNLMIIGMIIASVGSVAIIGYMSGTPLLYYYIKGVNSAIALHTAISFVLLGTGLICLYD